ncbi:MAG: hypothetical protein GY751_16105 [Bacteroidetes bacterium]|nr:hypothetical protein [Bacteroidota bacterium]
MLKDIDFEKVEDTAMAVVPEMVEGEQVWTAYLINTGTEVLESVLISSKGYGEIDKKMVKTSELRQMIELIEPGKFVKVEEIRDELFKLSNEFWISFSKQGYLFDKKYVFVPETLHIDNLTSIPVIEKPGVLIK